MDLRNSDELKTFLKNLPGSPGVYIMKGEDGIVLYVGKAVNLYNRVNSYFKPGGDERAFVSKLPRELVEIEIITVSTEREALLLENNLIKELKPKYNIFLRDDKSYMSIRINPKTDYPRFETVRGLPKDDGYMYFGPYQSSRSLRSILSFLGKYFKLRTCSDKKFKSRKRPCLRYYIERCDAPCVYNVSKKEYAEKIEEGILFLNGQTAGLIRKLKIKMNKASEELRFEEAAGIRDLIFALEKLKEPQDVVTTDFVSRDILGFSTEENRIALVIIEVRGGSVKTHRQTVLENRMAPVSEIMESYLAQHYSIKKEIPSEILVPEEFQEYSSLKGFLELNFGKSPVIKNPRTEHERNLAYLASSTAVNKLVLAGDMALDDQLKRLAWQLKLKKIPRKIECYDISHLQGSFTVGSMVVFIDGHPDTSKYRRFNIKNANPGDDFGALREVIRRRLSKRDQKGWDLPDLMVIDGGKGQLNTVWNVIKEFNLTLPVISLAKEREKDGPPDRYFKPGAKDPVHITKSGRELYILARLRDEAHRFAVEGHRKRRISGKFITELMKIDGVGKKTVKKLLMHFGSVENIKKSSINELMKVEGIGQNTARKIAEFLKE